MSPPPFLLMVQWMDCHPPWGPHPETDFDPLYGGTFDGSSAALVPFFERRPSDANLRRARDLYDGEIRWLDARLRDLFRDLQARGALDGAWVVVTSSHGMELWERGALGHRGSLSQEVLHVPLLIRPPGGISPPRVVSERFSLIDLAPTLIELLGLPGSADFDGVSWASFLLGRGAAPGHPVIACELGRDGDERAALLDGPHKLLANRGSGELRLYDLQSDPHERQPLDLPAGAPLPAIAERLRGELQRALDSAHARRPPPDWSAASLPPDVRRQLQALGELEGDG
jgi:arylsulfatase A-like enzyme